MTKKDYEKLSAIAPTIPHSGGYESAYFEPWDVQALMAGRALGKEAEATAMIDDLKQRFAEEAAAHPEFAATSAIFLQGAIYEGSAIAYQDGLSTDFRTDLGMEDRRGKLGLRGRHELVLLHPGPFLVLGGSHLQHPRRTRLFSGVH